MFSDDLDRFYQNVILKNPMKAKTFKIDDHKKNKIIMDYLDQDDKIKVKDNC